jgi:hypothetical protein
MPRPLPVGLAGRIHRLDRLVLAYHPPQFLPLSFGTEFLRIIKGTEFMLPLCMMRHMPGHWREMFLPLIVDRSGT